MYMLKNTSSPNTIVCNIYPCVVGLPFEFKVFNPILFVSLYINDDEISKKRRATFTLIKIFPKSFFCAVQI